MMIANLTDYQKVQEEMRLLEERLQRLQKDYCVFKTTNSGSCE